MISHTFRREPKTRPIGCLFASWTKQAALLLVVLCCCIAAPAARAGDKIASGYTHQLAVKADGTVWAWGSNEYGQLGNGTTTASATTVQVQGLTNVVSVAAGSRWSLALKADGTVWGWGVNQGFYGGGVSADSTVPRQVVGLSNVTDITTSCTRGSIEVFFAYALKSDGTLWAWGDNFRGKLGIGSLTPSISYMPLQVVGLTDVVAVDAGGTFGVAVKSDGTVWAWGEDAGAGVLGDSSGAYKVAPVQINNLPGIVKVSAGASHVLALDAEGRVWAWGQSSSGQLGVGSQFPSPWYFPVLCQFGLGPVQTIFAGSSHSLVIKANGQVMACGANDDGQVGGGVTSNVMTPVVVANVSSPVAVTAERRTSMALGGDGTIHAWGYNANGWLGLVPSDADTGFTEIADLTKFSNVSSGEGHVLAVGTNGGVRAWGANANYQLGTADTSSKNVPFVLPLLTGMKKVVAASQHGLAIRKSDGGVVIWGTNSYGSPPRAPVIYPASVAQFGSSNPAVGAALGLNHYVVLAANGAVWTWGRHNEGQLGRNVIVPSQANLPTNLSGLPSIVAVAASSRSSFALTSTGDVWGWGLNTSGQLGSGTQTNASLPQVVGTGVLNSVTQLATGADHVIALKSDGTVWGWGWNLNGQVGNGLTTNVLTPVEISGLQNIVAVGAGHNHSFAIEADGSIWSWGANNFGQLGRSGSALVPGKIPGLVGVVSVGGGTSFSVGLKQDGTIVTWGCTSASLSKAPLGIGRNDVRHDRSEPIHGFNLQGNVPTVSFGTPGTTITVPLGQTEHIPLTYLSPDSVSQGTGKLWYHGILLSEGQTGVATVPFAPKTWGDYVVTAASTDVNGKLSSRSQALTIHVPYDHDVDGLPDWWEVAHLQSLVYLPGDDPDGDGLSNAIELANGTSPSDYYNGQTPTLTLIDGDDQILLPETTSDAPVRVQVKDGTGATALVDVPVKFTVVSGDMVIGPGAPHGYGSVATLRTDAQGYIDLSLRAGTVPGDVAIRIEAGGAVLNVSATIESLADEDLDGMRDAWELAHGLSPYDGSDGLTDLDGDRIPNLVEFLKGTRPNDAQSMPLPDAVVNQALAGGSNTDDIYATLQEAYDAVEAELPSGGPSFALIQVTSGVYAPLDGSLVNKRVAWVAETGGRVVVSGSSTGMQLSDEAVVDGFVFSNETAIGQGHSTGVLIDPHVSLGEAVPEVRLINCVIRGFHNHQSDSMGLGNRFAGGIINRGANLWLVHCTLVNNTGSDADGIVAQAGTTFVQNSIVWSDPVAVGASGQSVWQSEVEGWLAIISSLVYGSPETSVDADPLLTSLGNLTALSPAINGGPSYAAVGVDIHGVTRPQGAGVDLGAEEWLDSDGDGLPDWWETLHGLDPALADGTVDADGDGVGSLAEYEAGSDPDDYYSQPNKINPVLEVVSGNHQQVGAEDVAALPLEVRIKNQVDGSNLVNAPVTFTVQSGGGVVLESGGSAGGTSSIQLRSDVDGKVRAYYRQPVAPVATSEIIASCTGAQGALFTVYTTGLSVMPSPLEATLSAGSVLEKSITLSNQTDDPVPYQITVDGGVAAVTKGSNYRWRSSEQDGGPEYQWTDISTTGTKLNVVSSDDEVSEEVELPFAFPFYAESFNSVFVHSNGYLTFTDQPTQIATSYLPSWDMPANLVAAFFADLNCAISGDVYYKADGDSLIIQYQDVAFNWGTELVTFQIVLHKDGRILLNYKDLNGNALYSFVGVQDASKETGLLVASDILQDEFAVLLTREHQWLAVQNPTGQLAAGEVLSVPVTFDATLIERGVHEGALSVQLGAEPGGHFEVPVTMTVDALPSVAITSPAEDFVHVPGTTVHLSATATDEEGPVTKVEYYINQTPIGVSTVAPYELDWLPNLYPGDNVLVAKAYDSRGGVAVSQEITIGADSNSQMHLEVVSGNSQIGVPLTLLPQPVVLAVKTPDGLGLAGVPVKVKVTQGGGLVQDGSQSGDTLVKVSDSQGLVSIGFKLGTDAINRITAGTVSAPTATATVTAYASSGGGNVGGDPGAGPSNPAPNPGGTPGDRTLDLGPNFSVSFGSIVPANPGGLGANDENYDRTHVKISWTTTGTPASGTGYLIQRRIGTGPWTQLTSIANPATKSCEDQGLKAGQRYLYRLVIVKDGIWSSPSESCAYEIPLIKHQYVKTRTGRGYKSGYWEFVNPSTPPKRYRSFTRSGTKSLNFGNSLGSYSFVGSITQTETHVPSHGDGAIVWDVTFAGHSSHTEHTVSYYASGNEFTTITNEVDADPLTGQWYGAATYLSSDSTNGPDVSESYSAFEDIHVGPSSLVSETQTSRHYYYSVDGDIEDYTLTLSNEYTSDSLMADTIGSMPDYGDWVNDELSFSWGGTSSEIEVADLQVNNYHAGKALSPDEGQAVVGNLKYKIKVNPSVTQTLEWVEVFVAASTAGNQVPQASRTFIHTKRSLAVGATGGESPEYEINGASGSKGWYYLSLLPRFEVWQNGASLNDDAETKEDEGVAIGAGQTSPDIEMEDVIIPGTKITISWTGSSRLKVFGYYKATGQWVELSNGQQINHKDWGTDLRVVSEDDAVQGDSIVLKMTTLAPDGTLLSTDKLRVGVERPMSLRVPVDEAAGARYRKIALNGRPLPDGKPQTTEESDQQDEETFVDALTLGLRHSVTDAFVSVAGSELPLEVRRSASTEVWTLRNGLRPHENPQRPFGAAWNSNLTPCIRVETPGGPEGSPKDPVFVYVTDENGSAYRFLTFQVEVGGAYFNRFVPFPTGQHERSAYLATLEEPSFGTLVFKKKFGSTLVFGYSSLNLQTRSDRLLGSVSSVSTGMTYGYYRLQSITDRMGVQLVYDYDQSESDTLVPQSISIAGRSDQAIYIRQNAQGLITSIWDPNWNETKYSYDFDAVRNEWLLVKVTDAHGKETHYTYNFADETDRKPRPVDSMDPGTTYIHCDLASVQDPNGNVFGFEYMFDHVIDGQGKFDYHWDVAHPELAGYYPTTGHPRMLKKVTLPAGLGVTSFENASITKIRLNAEGKFELTPDSNRETRVIDAEGQMTTYRWMNGVVCSVDTIPPSSPSDHIVAPKIIYFRKMTVEHDGFGTESFEFDENANLALVKSTDLSGNFTQFAYDDLWSAPAWYRQVFPFATTGLNGAYDDVTVQTNALGKARYFSYDARRIMRQVIDEEGRKTVYDTDALGRRTSESVYDPLGTLVQQSDFEYGNAAFPGVVTRKTVKKLAGDPSWVKNLATQYVLDGAGRVSQEIVVSSGIHLVTQHTYAPNGNRVSTTDPRGKTTWFLYDKKNRLTKVVLPDNSNRRLFYDDRGNKVKEIDQNGHATLYVYDELSRVKKSARDMNGNESVDASDLVTESEFNAVGSVVATKDPRGNVTTFVYDGLQRLKETHAPLGVSSTFQYGLNSGGSVFSSTPFKPTWSEDARGYVTEVTFDKLYRPTQTRVGYGAGIAVTNLEYDDVGNAVKSTDPLGKETETDYDALNRPERVTFDDATFQRSFYTSTGFKWKVQDELGRQAVTEFDGAGRAVKAVQPSVYDFSSGQDATPVTTTEYDKAGNVVAITNPLGYRSTFGYDDRNRKIWEKLPEVWDAESAAFVQPVTLTQYDDVGNVIKVTNARGHATDTEYDEANRAVEVKLPLVTKPDNTTARPTTVTAYDKNGNVHTVTDPNGKVTTNTYDALNRLHTTTDAEGMVVTNEYDKAGNRTAVIDGKNQRTEFEYDGFNRNTVIRDALNRETVFTYNDVNKTARVDAEGQRTEYGYDDRHRLKTVTYIGRTVDNRTYTYDAVGNLLGVVEPGKAGKADVGYTYDAHNRVSTETSGGITHQYHYDRMGNRCHVLYGGTGLEITSTFDACNRLWYMAENGHYSSYAYNAVGGVAVRSLTNGDVTTTIFDALNRPTQIQGTAAGNLPLYVQTMKYDLAGNVVEVQENNPSGLANRTVVNTYDDVYRLVNESTTEAGGGTVSVTYGYDDANNRSQKVVVGGPTPGTTDYTYNSINQLTGWTDGTNTVSYTYDLNGNRESRTQGADSDALTWDYENRLITFDKNTGDGQGLYTFAYDYRTRRIETAKDADPVTTFVFSGGTSVQEREGGVLAAEFVRGSDMGGGVGGMLYSLRSGTRSFTHYNTRGDVVAKTDGAGGLTYQAAYEAWGEIKAEVGSTLDRQKSNSKDRDVPGYANEGFRYRDLETGAFLSKDPLGFVDGPNVYAYVRQNPWTAFDPDGLYLRDIYNWFDRDIATPATKAIGFVLASAADGALNAFVAGYGGPGKHSYEPSPIRRNLGMADNLPKIDREAYNQMQDAFEGMVLCFSPRINPQIRGRVEVPSLRLRYEETKDKTPQQLFDAARFEIAKSKTGSFEMSTSKSTFIRSSLIAGQLSFEIERQGSAGFSGKDLFRSMMDFYGPAVQRVRGCWIYGDNLAEVNRLTMDGKVPIKEAIKHTWTAKMAAEYGYSEATLEKAVGQDGKYVDVRVVFSKKEVE